MERLLVARVYKAGYFPNSQYLESTGVKASFMWSGTCKSKEDLFSGFRWVVGNGSDINLYTDLWLRGKSDLSVDCVYMHRHDNTKVRSLFLPSSRSWNVQHITKEFVEADAKAILSTPVPCYDVLIE